MKIIIRLTFLGILLFSFSPNAQSQAGPFQKAEKVGHMGCPDGTLVVRCRFGEGPCKPEWQLECGESNF